MNAVEHIVECYFRYCKGCFTMVDVKIPGGNNRQCDLLAYNAKTQEQYHVESSVTHQENWCPSTKELSEIFDKKFRGVPPKREGKNTDFVKGKTYYENILQSYQSVGLDLRKLQRIIVTWDVSDATNLDGCLVEYEQKSGLHIQVWSFRDKILPELTEKISTSNYDDEILRTLSLLRQRDLQISTSNFKDKTLSQLRQKLLRTRQPEVKS